MYFRKLPLLGISVLMLVAEACGSSQPAANTAPASAPAAQAATATPPPPSPTPTPAAPDFASIMKAGLAGFKASYNLKVVEGDKTSLTATTTMYVKPPKTRIDTVAQIQGKDMPASMFMLEDGNYACADMGGGKNCLRLPKTAGQIQGDPASSLFSDLKDKTDDYALESKGSRQIAGTTAYCFNVKKKTNPDGSQVEACYSADGIPLAFIIKDKGKDTQMEATSFAKSVADDDFKLPAQPMELPGMPAGIPNMPGIPGR